MTAAYFPHAIQINTTWWESLALRGVSRQVAAHAIPDIIFYRQLALRFNRQRPDGHPSIHAGQLNMYATLLKVYRHLVGELSVKHAPGLLTEALQRSGHNPDDPEAVRVAERFV